MVVQRKGIHIAIWVTGAVLLVIVVGLTVFLICRRRRRRQLRKVRRQFLEADNMTMVSNTENNEWAGGTVALRGHGGEDGAVSGLHFPGFRRRTTEELEALPCPAGAATFAAPLVVYLRVRPDQAYMESCDILLTVDRLRDSTPLDRSSRQLLGNDSYYHDDYLLYTAPLEFREAGVYVIHAFTVHPSKEVVGAVHQFTYVVTSGALTIPGSAVSTAHRYESTIDVDVARRLAESHYSPSTLAVSEPAAMAAAAVPPSFALQRSGPPLPPVIVPSGGEVTTSTDIVITPHELSTTADQLRYSVDGSYPNLLYTGPFTLGLPPPSLLPSQRRTVIVKAIAVRAFASTSDQGAASAAAEHSVSAITRAVMEVRPAGFSYYDPQVPAPSMRLRATGATLYFDESHNPPHTQTVFELVYITDARRTKVRYSRQRAQVYDGQPLVLSENVASVHAWTTMSPSAAAASRGADVEDRVRSVPTIYDCTRAATERGKLSRRRIEQYSLRPEELLPPPVMCVSCGDVELLFDDPPANGRIAYTLNDTEPALCDVYPPACAVPLESDGRHPHDQRSRGKAEGGAAASPMVGDRDGAHTFLYYPGKRVHVTQLETQQVFVTARIFVPIFEGSDGALYGNSGGQGGSCTGSGKLLGYRFGGVFHRGFYFNNNAE